MSPGAAGRILTEMSALTACLHNGLFVTPAQLVCQPCTNITPGTRQNLCLGCTRLCASHEASETSWLQNPLFVISGSGAPFVLFIKMAIKRKPKNSFPRPTLRAFFYICPQMKQNVPFLWILVLLGEPVDNADFFH